MLSYTNYLETSRKLRLPFLTAQSNRVKVLNRFLHAETIALTTLTKLPAAQDAISIMGSCAPDGPRKRDRSSTIGSSIAPRQRSRPVYYRWANRANESQNREGKGNSKGRTTTESMDDCGRVGSSFRSRRNCKLMKVILPCLCNCDDQID